MTNPRDTLRSLAPGHALYDGMALMGTITKADIVNEEEGSGYTLDVFRFVDYTDPEGRARTICLHAAGVEKVWSITPFVPPPAAPNIAHLTALFSDGEITREELDKAIADLRARCQGCDDQTEPARPYRVADPGYMDLNPGDLVRYCPHCADQAQAESHGAAAGGGMTLEEVTSHA